MSPTFVAWATLFFDALGVVASLAAIVVYIGAYRHVRALPQDGRVSVPVSVIRRWLVTNALFIALIALNMTRWLVLNDIYPLMGKPTQVGAVDDLTWAVCDLLLVLMPLILISRILFNPTAVHKEDRHV